VKQGHAVLVWPIDRNQVNYVYVGDVARAITALAKMNINNDGEANAAIYIINTPATMQQFYEASASAIGVPAKAWVVPKWPLSTIATLFDSLSSVTGWRLPLTKNKIKELSNQQIFEVSKLKRKQPHFPYFGLHEGLRRICIDYRERGLL
jgi:nucleoside-diphosphate-sugar epimerase